MVRVEHKKHTQPQQRILFGVLNWGLGHATRSSPLIRSLLELGHSVEIASDGLALAYLQKEFPELTTHKLRGYDIKYANNKNLLTLKLICQLPKLKSAIVAEHKRVEELTQSNHYDLILSDNRYGFYSSSTKNVLITHQLRLITPTMFQWINNSLANFQNKFDALFVPDKQSPSDSLSGDLSHSIQTKTPVHFIGPVSQFSNVEFSYTKKDIDFLILLSGPEPQRTILEKELINAGAKTDKKVVLVRGTQQPFATTTKFETYDVVLKPKLIELFERSKAVVCRSGYSTLMDLQFAGLPAILIPTPGQTEQEYLAKLHSKQSDILVVNQSEITPDVFNWSSENERIKKASTLDKSSNGKAFKNALNAVGFPTPTL